MIRVNQRGCVSSEINVPNSRHFAPLASFSEWVNSNFKIVDISGTKRATKNLRIPNWSYRRGDSFSGPKLQLNGLETCRKRPPFSPKINKKLKREIKKSMAKFLRLKSEINQKDMIRPIRTNWKSTTSNRRRHRADSFSRKGSDEPFGHILRRGPLENM